MEKQEKVVFYDVGQVASLFKVEKQTVRRWIKEGWLNALKFGNSRKWYFDEKYILKKLNRVKVLT